MVILLLVCIPAASLYSWGFFAHRRINRLAVYTLPPEMFPFYKKHIQLITENAVNPDSRRYVVKGEAPRHYIDIDVYGDSAIYTMPRYWFDAVEQYTQDTLEKYGIVPWHVNLMKIRLTKAFEEKNPFKILNISAEIGHYIADSNVPLHTTLNYNGQLTGQRGIHAFWETRIPEVFSDEFDFFVGQAEYVENPQLRAWDAVTQAHLAKDSVLNFERLLTEKMGEDKKYSFETRGNQTVKTYSLDFTKAYHKMLNGQVERQMRASIKQIGDFWYTAWVDAGQPNLDHLLEYEINEKERKQFLKEREKALESQQPPKARDHETY